MDGHVKVLGILYIIFNSLVVVAGVCFLLAAVFGGVMGVGLAASDEEAAAGFAGMGAVMGMLGCGVMVLGLPGFLGGIGIMRYSSFWRVVMIVLSVLNLLSFPLGTALGIYGLWVLLHRETVMLFEWRGQIPPAAYQYPQYPEQ